MTALVPNAEHSDSSGVVSADRITRARIRGVGMQWSDQPRTCIAVTQPCEALENGVVYLNYRIAPW